MRSVCLRRRSASGSTGTGSCSIILIDCGAGRNTWKLLDNFAQHGFSGEQMEWIILTHAHADHSGGAAMLQRRFDSKVVCSKQTARLVSGGEEALKLGEAREQGIYPADYHYEPCEPSLMVEDGDILCCGGLEVHFLASPATAMIISAFIFPSLQRCSAALRYSTTACAGKLPIIRQGKARCQPQG
ncbi:MBL fold metallo-hydrolase [Paenibacillus sp. GCM10027626]|uniref:MBL fold metallo-hydrolase n=1 Tax=Paenibacillus sp. GCM10027626 TaxID=3273411 RepID=UPI003643FFA9